MRKNQLPGWECAEISCQEENAHQSASRMGMHTNQLHAKSWMRTNQVPRWECVKLLINCLIKNVHFIRLTRITIQLHGRECAKLTNHFLENDQSADRITMRTVTMQLVAQIKLCKITNKLPGSECIGWTNQLPGLECGEWPISCPDQSVVNDQSTAWIRVRGLTNDRSAPRIRMRRVTNQLPGSDCG